MISTTQHLLTVLCRFYSLTLVRVLQRVNDYIARGADVDYPKKVPTCAGLVKKNVSQRRNPSPGPHRCEPICWLRLIFPSLNVLEMVPWDNMSGQRGLIVSLKEGPILTFKHMSSFLFSGTLRLDRISPQSFFSLLGLVLSPLLQRLMCSFLPALCLMLLRNLILHKNSLH